MIWRNLIGVCVVLMLAGCSSLLPGEAEDRATEESEAVNSTAEELYNKAQNLFNIKEFKGAIEAFEEVERQHPYSEWATRGQIMAAYSAYRAQEFEQGIVILDRFVKLHPTHKDTPYAYYLKALCNYDQISDVGRDQKMTREAQQALRDVVARFPTSKYAQDAQLKLDLTEDHLAGKEMEIGRYYLIRDEYLAAINRFRYVVENYQTTSHAPEALHRLVEAYLRLGVKDEAKRYAAVLGYNYPGSEWYQYSYAMLNGDVNPEKTVDKHWTDYLLP